jgi:hypothetical protein
VFIELTQIKRSLARVIAHNGNSWALLRQTKARGKRRGEEGMATKKATRLSDGLSCALADGALDVELERRLLLSCNEETAAEKNMATKRWPSQVLF